MKNSFYYCHNGNGRNFGIEISGKMVRIFNYHTNGNQNSDYAYGRFVDLEKLKKELGDERMKLIMEEGKDAGQLERLYFNGY
jgi:hypothetical protein